MLLIAHLKIELMQYDYILTKKFTGQASGFLALSTARNVNSADESGSAQFDNIAK